MEYVIDVKNKPLGRAASETAAILRGKNTPAFKPNVAPKIKVVIENIDEIKITGKKSSQKEYKRYSGYIGKVKSLTMNEVKAKKGMAYLFKEAVNGMLPKNKLRKQMLKNLIIK